MAHASNRKVREAERGPSQFKWRGTTYQWGWNGILLYDAQEAAEAMAEELGVRVKHAANKFPTCGVCGDIHWSTMSVVLHR